MILCIDSGNSSIKTAVFDDNQKLVYQITFTARDFDFHRFHEFNIKGVCISNVGKLELFNIPKNVPVIEVSYKLKFPFSIEYDSPTSIGADRLALSTGAIQKYPKKNLLIIDAGTCVTYDFITSNGIYKGGIISPGIEMRLKAMHHFTGKLPLLQSEPNIKLLGTSTTTCMQSGALNGLRYEMEGFINAFLSEYIELKTIITGGNSQLLAKQIQSAIFAEPNLLLNGLYQIYKINVG